YQKGRLIRSWPEKFWNESCNRSTDVLVCWARGLLACSIRQARRPPACATMKVLIAPDKFKGALNAREVAENIAKGLRDALPDAEIDIVPMADGGEGTAEAIWGFDSIMSTRLRQVSAQQASNRKKKTEDA